MFQMFIVKKKINIFLFNNKTKWFVILPLKMFLN